MICEINLFDGWMDFLVLKDKKIVDRWSYSGHKEHIMHLMEKVHEHEIVLTEEQKILIQKVQDSFVYPDKSIIKLEIEKARILAIKQKTGQIINSKYDIYWQLNHPRLDASYANQYEWIDNIRAIGNKAELEGTALEDIDWGAL